MTLKSLKPARIGCWVLLAGLSGVQLAGCGARLPKSPPLSSTLSRKAPVPPAGSLPNLKLPESDGKGGFRTMNSDITPAEAVWHVRSALNVAALTCDDRGIVSNYNALLKRQKIMLTTAYQSESRRFGSAAAMDGHMTKLYNFFAQPPAQHEFCIAAGSVAAEALLVPGRQFEHFARAGIARIDRPFQNFYRAYALYQRDLAAWRAGRGVMSDRVALAPRATAEKQLPAGSAPWRVQLGAFSGPDAARSAWIEVRRRAPGLAAFQPHYEPASVRNLVRLQIGPVTDRQEALRLCAAAAVAALDCLPVSPS